MSSITITFNSNPLETDEITIQDSYTPGIAMNETFASSRTQAGQSALGNNTGATAQNYRTALIADYNGSGLYVITYNSSAKSVTITGNNASSQFSVTANTTAGAVTTSTNNTTPPPTGFSIDNVTFSAAADPCTNIKVSIGTSTQATSISSPISQSVGTNPFIFETPRKSAAQGKVSFIMHKGAESDSELYYIPQLLPAFFKVDVINSPSGASATVNFAEAYYADRYALLGIEYSDDNTTWQTSPDFYGLAVGNHTVYIRDNVGCSTSIDYTVSEFTASIVDYEPYANISNVNPIRYKRDEVWSDTNRKNPHNTLSYEERDTINNRSYLQPFITGDNITTQVSTNYSVVTASYFDCDDNEVAIAVEKKTDNMDKTDVRDGILYSKAYNSQNYVAVRFQSGTTYDPITLQSNGSYNLLDQTPDWMDNEEYINIEGVGWLQILAKVYDTTHGAYVLILNRLASSYPIAFGTARVTSVYNLLDTDFFEFDFDMTGLDGNYYIVVVATHLEYGTVNWTSEWISIRATQRPHYRIEYYNSENNPINYSTGVTFMLRVPYVHQLRYSPSVEQDIYVTDTRTVLNSSLSRDFYEMVTKPLPTSMAQKVVLALQHDRLKIENQTFLMEGEPEVKKFGKTNLYQVRATLVESDSVFDNYQGASFDYSLGEPLIIDDSAGGFLFVD